MDSLQNKDLPPLPHHKESSPSSRNTRKMASLITRCMTGLGVVLTVMWALITYVVPDPSVFGFSFVSWKNVILLVSTFLFLMAISIGWQTRNFAPLFRGLLQTCMAAFLCISFFILGSEYAKPSFEFTKQQSNIVENDGSNLLGKRMEVLDNIRIEMIGCENIGRLPTCTFELTNRNVDRDFRFNEESQLFDEAGASLKLRSVRVGQAEGDYWLNFQLVRNVPTRITLTFQQSNSKLSKTPAIKLAFRNAKSETLILKFSEVGLQ